MAPPTRGTVPPYGSPCMAGGLVSTGTFPRVGWLMLLIAGLVAAQRGGDTMDPGWPNVLIAFVAVVVVGAVVVSVVLLRRVRATLPDARRRRQ